MVTANRNPWQPRAIRRVATLKETVNEVGLFGNQNTVCQPTAQKWRHTVERLKTRFRN